MSKGRFTSENQPEDRQNDINCECGHHDYHHVICRDCAVPHALCDAKIAHPKDPLKWRYCHCQKLPANQNRTSPVPEVRTEGWLINRYRKPTAMPAVQWESSNSSWDEIVAEVARQVELEPEAEVNE